MVFTLEFLYQAELPVWRHSLMTVSAAWSPINLNMLAIDCSTPHWPDRLCSLASTHFIRFLHPSGFCQKMTCWKGFKALYLVGLFSCHQFFRVVGYMRIYYFYMLEKLTMLINRLLFLNEWITKMVLIYSLTTLPTFFFILASNIIVLLFHYFTGSCYPDEWCRSSIRIYTCTTCWKDEDEAM